MSDQFEYMQEVLVSSLSLTDAMKGDKSCSYFYLCSLEDGMYAVKYAKEEAKEYGVAVFKYVVTKPIPPVKVPYTFETFPRGVVYVRSDESDCLVLNIKHNEITIGTSGNVFYLSMQGLLKHCQISTDLCKTWQEAGYTPKESWSKQYTTDWDCFQQ